MGIKQRIAAQDVDRTGPSFKSRWKVSPLLPFLPLLGAPNPLLAQTDPALWSFQTSLDPEGLFSASAGERLEPNQLDLGVSLSRTLGMTPPTLAQPFPLEGDILQRTRLDALASWAPNPKFQLGLALPLVFDSAPSFLLPLEGTVDQNMLTGLGDVRLNAFFPLSRTGIRYPDKGGPFAFGAFATVTLPTGDGQRFAALGRSGLEFGAAIEGGAAPHIVANTSFEIVRPAALTGEDARLHGRLHGRLGAVVTLKPHALEGLLETHLTGELLPEPGAAEQLLFEALLGARVRTMTGWSVTLGAGVACTPAVPWSLQTTLALHRQLPPNRIDRDFDGISDLTDLCRQDAEDKDQFQDEDGCPEPDNDLDALVDSVDLCPFDAEDKDNYKDADGCPEPDNDKDGVLDVQDRCPMDPEDVDKFQDIDGCPEPDNDRDGLLDARDKCPNDAEDKDRFQDEDGCPDPDNDGDGVLDPKDKCLNTAEDADGFQDDDGCPEPDNDQDGLPDSDDYCPEEAEDAVDSDVQDGCPSSRPIVRHGERMLVLEDVQFDPTDASVLTRSREVLEQLANALKQEPPGTRFRLEVYAEARGDEALNLRRSNSRAAAIAQVLKEYGVGEEVLTFVGYGELAVVDVQGQNGLRLKVPRVQVQLQMLPSPER